MRMDCILQQLVRGYISFSHLQEEGEKDGCNHPLQTQATSLHLAFGESRPFPASLHHTKLRRTGQGEMSMRQTKWGAQISKEWQKYFLHMSNYILLVKMAWRTGSWSGSRVQCRERDETKGAANLLQQCMRQSLGREGLIASLHFLFRSRNAPLEREFCFITIGNIFGSVNCQLPPAFWGAAMQPLSLASCPVWGPCATKPHRWGDDLLEGLDLLMK